MTVTARASRNCSEAKSRACSAKGLIARIGKVFDALPPEVRKAARYVTANPSEVAFRSMRSTASAAQVSPSTMVRFARALGLDGFDELRAAFQAQIHSDAHPFVSRAEALSRNAGDSTWGQVHALMNEELASIHAFVKTLDDRDLDRAERLLSKARRIYVMGLRGMHPAAFLFHYSVRMFSDKCELVDAAGGTYLDVLRNIAAPDVLLVFTCKPYPVEIVRALTFAHERKARILAVTDGTLSPAVRLATLAFEVRPTRSTLLSSATANVLVARVLSTVLLAAAGPSSVDRVRAAERHFAAFDVYSDI